MKVSKEFPKLYLEKSPQHPNTLYPMEFPRSREISPLLAILAGLIFANFSRNRTMKEIMYLNDKAPNLEVQYLYLLNAF